MTKKISVRRSKKKDTAIYVYRLLKGRILKIKLLRPKYRFTRHRLKGVIKVRSKKKPAKKIKIKKDLPKKKPKVKTLKQERRAKAKALQKQLAAENKAFLKAQKKEYRATHPKQRIRKKYPKRIVISNYIAKSFSKLSTANLIIKSNQMDKKLYYEKGLPTYIIKQLRCYFNNNNFNRTCEQFILIKRLTVKKGIKLWELSLVLFEE